MSAARGHLRSVPSGTTAPADCGKHEASGRDSDVISAHLSWFARTGATERSLVGRRDNLFRLARALPCDLLDASFRDLDRWQGDLQQRRNSRGAALAPNTLVSYSAHARAFYRWAVEAGHLEHSPAERLPRPRRPRGPAHPVPERDLLLVLAVAPEPVRTWLLLAAFMGLRAAEIAQLRRDSVEEIDGRLVLSGMGKGRKPFRLIVPQHVEPALRLCMSARGPLWIRPGGAPYSASRLSRLVADFFRGQDMPYTMHWARHSFGTAVYQQTRDLLLTQDAMRHESPSTTRIYVATSRAEAVAAADQLAGRLLGGAS